MALPLRWSSSTARAHAVVVGVLTQAEILNAARRFAGRTTVPGCCGWDRASGGFVRLCRDELESMSASMAGISAVAGSA
jgi:hypothetical protein